MKNKQISATLFAILFILQTFIVRYILEGAAITSIPIIMFFDVAALVVFGLVAAKLFAGKDVSPVMAMEISLMYIFFNVIFYETQLVLISSSLSTINAALAATTTVSVVVMIVRAALMIIASWILGRSDKINELQPVEMEAEEAIETAEPAAVTAAVAEETAEAAE